MNIGNLCDMAIGKIFLKIAHTTYSSIKYHLNSFPKTNAKFEQLRISAIWAEIKRYAFEENLYDEITAYCVGSASWAKTEKLHCCGSNKGIFH